MVCLIRRLYFCFAAKATAHEKAEAAAAIKKGVLKDDFSQKRSFIFLSFPLSLIALKVIFHKRSRGAVNETSKNLRLYIVMLLKALFVTPYLKRKIFSGHLDRVAHGAAAEEILAACDEG